MCAKRTEKKEKAETNLGIGYRSDNERMRIGGWSLRIQSWSDSGNDFLKWVQEDVLDIMKPYIK